MKKYREDKIVAVKTKGQPNFKMIFRLRIIFKMAGKNLKCQNLRIVEYHRIKKIYLVYIHHIVDRSVKTT